MSEETNPWKKQMMNKSGASNNSVPPAPSAPTEMNNPWKQKLADQNLTKLPASSNPWKAQQGNSPSQPPSQVPWKKQDSPAPATQSSQPSNPWKTNSPSTTSNNPWMKGKMQKQKEQRQKQQQQRLLKQQQQRLLKEQEQRKQKQQQQKKLEQQKLAKQKQDEQRQTNLMKKQEQFSILYQAYLREKQQQNKKNKISQSKNSVSKSKPKVKKEKQVKKELIVSNFSFQPDGTLASRYYLSFQALLDNDSTFAQRLEKQKQIISIYKEFEDTNIQKIKQIIQSHDIPQNINLENGISLSFIRTRSERKQTQGQVFYDEVRMRQVKRQMEIMNGLQNSLIDTMRKRGTSKIRISLKGMIQYKGVLCLIKAQCKEEEGTGYLQVSKFPQISAQVSLLIKEINSSKDFINSPLKVEHFVFKNAHNSQSEQIYIVSLREGIKQILNIPGYQLKQNQLVQDFNWFQNNLQKIIDSPYLQNSKQKQKLQYFGEQIKTLQLSRKILQIYRSAQGQLDDQNFIRVVIKMQNQFSELLQDSGYKERLSKNRGILLLILEKLTGLVLEYTENVFDDNEVRIKQILPIYQGYTFNTLQYIDVSNRYLTLFQQDKVDLAAQLMVLRLDLQQNNQQKTTLTLDNAEFLYLQQKYTNSLSQLQSIRTQIRPYTLQSIRMLTLFIKNHIALSQESQLLQKFSTALSQLNFIFGEETRCNSQLYGLLAAYYSKREQRLGQVLGLYQLAFNIDKKILGQKSVESGDIYLVQAHTYIVHKKFQEAQFSLEQANKIYQSTHNKSRKAEVTIAMGELAFAQGDKKTGQQCFNKALKAYQKIGKYKELQKVLLVKLVYEKQQKARQNTIHELYKLGNQYNSRPIIKNSLILALKQESLLLSRSKIQKLKELIQSLQQKQDDNQQSQIQKIYSLDEFQKNLKMYNSIGQLLHWLFSLLDTPGKIDKYSNILNQIRQYVGTNKFDETIIGNS